MRAAHWPATARPGGCMGPILQSAVAAARRRRGRQRGGPSLFRLVLLELAWAVGQVLRPTQLGVAGVVALVVGVALGPRTPGPVLSDGPRIGLAVLLGIVALQVAHALLTRRRDASADDLLYVLRLAVGVVLALTVVALVTGRFLAAVTSQVAEPSLFEPTLDAGLAIDGAVLLGAVVLLLAVLTTSISTRFAVPGSLLFLGVGMLVGSDGLGLVALDDPQLVQSIGVAALVVILFDGGLGTRGHQLRAGAGPGLALATVGVLVTVGVTALGAMALLDVPRREAWLLGAIIGSTDASAVFALLRQTPLRTRPAAVLQLESGVNDPIAVLLTVGLLAAWEVPPDAGAWLVFGVVQLVGGVVVGVAAGWFGAGLLRRVPLPTAGLHPILALAVAGTAYGTAALLGASGLLAVYLSGVVLGAEAPRRRAALRAFSDALAIGAEIGLFLLLGLLVFPSQLPAVTAVSLGVVALLLFVARPVAVLTSLAPFRLPLRELAAISWLGVRGGVPIVLATLAFSAGVDAAQTIFNVVFFVVLTSSLLQGATASRLVRALGLEAVPGADDVVTAVTPLDDVAIDVLEVDVPAGSPLVDRLLAEVPPPDDLLLVGLIRDGDVVVPRGPTRLRAGDRVIATTRDQRHGRTRFEAWVGVGEGEGTSAGRQR